MILNSIGFVGGGRIARILMGGWRLAGTGLGDVVVSDPDSTAIDRLIAENSNANLTPGDIATAAHQSVVFLAVHPPLLPTVLEGIAGKFRDDTVVISLAPKFTIAKLSAMLNGFDRIVRMIPNAASIVGRGYNPLTWSESLPECDRGSLRELLSPLGRCPDVAESNLETYAVVTAMGPTYFWPQWSELLSIAEEFELPRQDALIAVRSMLDGAMATLFDSGMTDEEVLDLIPVKPLGELEPTLRDAYRKKLSAVIEKLRP